MNVSDVQKMIRSVKTALKAADYESAHGHEDDLAWAVIEAIAEERCPAEEAPEVCAQALKVLKLEYPRRCS